MTWYDVTAFRVHRSHAACTECHLSVYGFNRWNAHSSGQRGICEHVLTGASGLNLISPVAYVEGSALSQCGCGCESLMVTPVPPEERVPLTARAMRLAQAVIYCPDCRTLFTGAEQPETYEVAQTSLGTSGQVCGQCRNIDDAYTTCEHCENATIYANYSAYETADGRMNLCGDCRNDYYETCPHCANLVTEGMSCCDDDEISAECDCYTCRQERRGRIRSYSWKPEPSFHTLGDGTDTRTGSDERRRAYDATPYLGFELELEVPHNKDRYDIAGRVMRGLGQSLTYAKEDGSIGHGFELVTHPATFEYLMERVNWPTLREMRKDKLITATDNCGLHIHVSKAGFSGKAHEYRWLLFWYRNQEVMTALADRDSSYARFHESSRGSLKSAITKGIPRERYTAINTNNTHTHEVRVFASTLYVNRIRAAIQLVYSTVEYTRSLAAAKVLRDGGFQWAEYVAWLVGHGAKYRDLLTRIDTVVTDKVEASEPRYRDLRAWVGSDRYGDSLYEYKAMITQEKIVKNGKVTA